MPLSHTEEEWRAVLERAFDAYDANRHDHIRHKNGELWNVARDIEKLDACCHLYKITYDDYWAIVIECLELAIEDPAGTYKQPESAVCDHDEANGEEMFAFVVKHADFTRPIYIKYALTLEPDGEWYFSISCHP